MLCASRRTFLFTGQPAFISRLLATLAAELSECHRVVLEKRVLVPVVFIQGPDTVLHHGEIRPGQSAGFGLIVFILLGIGMAGLEPAFRVL